MVILLKNASILNSLLQRAEPWGHEKWCEKRDVNACYIKCVENLWKYVFAS